ncbi:MAG TPA: monovalent cation/H+ antiporter subunit D family protein [Gammaproteobacteria bacterium]|nr:monovalent cation/H+ antiporter subunit D family protein [Gammaproteobacteria bacterium]
MIAHLPALQVVLPLLFAPVCVLLRQHTLVWLVTLLVSWAVFIMACLSIPVVFDIGPLSYELGGWAAPWGIEYKLDQLSAFVVLIVTAIGAIVITYARQSVTHEIPRDRVYLFYTAYLLNLTGILGVVVTGDVFNLFVFIEISSLSSYALISIGRDRRALMAAYRYLVLGTIGATFILIGVGLLYVMTGTLNIDDLQQRLVDLEEQRTVITALAFLTVGISLKFALFPLHFWLPNAYTYAPSVISVFLASTTTKVFIYVLLRFLFSIFGASFVYDVVHVDRILLICSVLAIFSGSLSAIYQDNIKRMLAYSSIAQIGYMVLGVGLASVTGVLAGIIHLFNHALMKAALFMCMGCVFYRIGSVSIGQMKGIGRTMPWTMAAFVIAGLSLVGVPLTVGFISKWYLIQAAIEQDNWVIVITVLAGSLLAMIYIWRVVEAAYFQEPDIGTDTAGHGEAPPMMVIALWVVIIANIYFGINAEMTSGFARRSAEFLLGAWP